MFKKAPNEMMVSVKRLARADRNRCTVWKLVETELIEENERSIKEILTYKNMENGVLYQVISSHLKKVKRFNGRSNVKLERKNKSK